MDYSSILSNKEKRRLLMDKFENQRNIIEQCVEEHAEEIDKSCSSKEMQPLTIISDMEELVMMMDKFLETHFVATKD